MEEYKNPITTFLANFMQKEETTEENPLDSIDFGVPKLSKLPIDVLASKLDRELYEKEWFVTGNVNPAYFADDFEFQDPDVKLSGIEGTSGTTEFPEDSVLVSLSHPTRLRQGCLQTV